MSKGTTGAGLGARWDSMNPPLTPWILDVVERLGLERMTPVQAGTIPRAMKNQDCVVEAVTGSGKTLAFIIPTLERIMRREERYKKGEVAAVIIAPTRELAQQIHDVFLQFISTLHNDPAEAGPSTPPPAPAIPLPLLVTSGTVNPYDTFLQNSSNIIIGTPGRLASFLLSPRGLSAVRVSELDSLILDEADRLLSAPDHRRDVERIMGHLPKLRRTHLFSATMTDAVEEVVGLGLRNPVRIVVNLKDKRAGGEAVERRTPTGLQNTYLVCRHAEKTLQLIRVLQRESRVNEAAKFIVYFSTCAAVDYFYRVLSKLPALSSFHLTSFHGDLPPRIRETALSTFIAHPSSYLSPAVLLCTDVAARGVDFENVDVVVQYDPPTDPKTFSHRAGRTARAGRKGKGVVLLGKGREEDYIEFLALRKIPLIPYPYIDDQLQLSEIPSSLDPAASALLEKMRDIVKTDRELADKAAKSFVSSLRAYTKHEASYIFRATDLDFYSLATSFGLLRLPAMPEVRDWKKRREAAQIKREKAVADGKEVEDEVEDEIPWLDADIDWDNFAYSSKQREQVRLTALAEKKAAPPKSESDLKKKKIRAEMREAWSEQKERKARKEDRKDKKDKRKAAEWAAKGDQESIGLVESFKRKQREESPGEGFDHEYKTLKREVKEERAGKKGKKEISTSMFDDLD